MPEAFQERRRPRPFRIVHIPLEDFVQRFILRRPGVQTAPRAEAPPVQVPASSREKAVPWKCGVAELDEQYETLVKVIRQFQRSLKSGADPGGLEEALASLEAHVERHLDLEEAYLEHIRFPGLAEHRLGHQAFRHQIKAIHQRIQAGDPSAGLELSQQLFAWLRLHVMKEDAAWSQFARSRRHH